MTLTGFTDYNELFSTCLGYWDLHGSLLPIIGSLTGSATGATTTTDRFGVANKVYAFSGSSQYITIGDTNSNIKSIVLWVKLDNTTGSILKLTDTPHKVTVSSGTVATSGWPTTVTIYVDNAAASTLDTSWHMLTITTSGTAFEASNIIMGYDGSAYLTGSLGEFLIFSSQLSLDQIKQLYKIMSKKVLYPIQPGVRGVE